MMKNYIQQIIELFGHNEYSLATRRKVQRWLADDNHAEEKKEALHTLWQQAGEQKVPRGMQQSILRMQQNLGMQSVGSGKKYQLLIWRAAAIFLLAVSSVSIYLMLEKDKPQKDLVECFIPTAEIRELTLPDGTRVMLNSRSTLLYPEQFAGKTRSVYLIGEANFKVKPDKLHPTRIGRQTWANPKFRFREGLTSKVPTTDCALQICDSLWLNRAFKKEYLQKIADVPLRDKRYRYSCVGFILLQQLVEVRSGMPLDEFLAKEFYMPMGLKRTGYLPLKFLQKDEIVPSSVDPFLRKTTLQGFVHDESAAFQGGISGNAGLFSTAEEVAKIYQMLLNDGELDGKRYLSKETCRLFTTTVSKTSRRGLGFDKPDMQNPKSSPCAPSAPISVYGHTGFTGTCAWVDPDNGLIYVFLSNRVYPNTWNTKLQELEIRERIQEAMYQALLTSRSPKGTE